MSFDLGNRGRAAPSASRRALSPAAWSATFLRQPPRRRLRVRVEDMLVQVVADVLGLGSRDGAARPATPTGYRAAGARDRRTARAPGRQPRRPAGRRAAATRLRRCGVLAATSPRSGRCPAPRLPATGRPGRGRPRRRRPPAAGTGGFRVSLGLQRRLGEADRGDRLEPGRAASVRVQPVVVASVATASSLSVDRPAPPTAASAGRRTRPRRADAARRAAGCPAVLGRLGLGRRGTGGRDLGRAARCRGRFSGTGSGG